MDRRTKEQIVSELQERLKQANLGVLTRFNAMNVEKMEALRNALRKNDADLKVVQSRPILRFCQTISNGPLRLSWATRIR